MRLARWTAGVGALALATFGVVTALPPSVGAAPSCSGTTTVTCTFSFTGAADSFTVPAGVTSVMVVAFGAQGGSSQDGVSGGLGGQATATISVTPGETLQVNVGGRPSTGNPANGGFNGGGPGGAATGTFGALVAGGGGGGASDVRQGGAALANRVVIGGGGGGGGGNSAGPCTGGTGGGTTGAPGATCGGLEGTGATQSMGGGGGMGGAGGAAFSPGSGAHSGGGGGGGLFGGGGGSGVPGQTIIAGGGGGGSGFTPTGAGLTSGVRSADGLVTITYTLSSPTITTSATPTATAGDTISDSATFSGLAGSGPFGTVSFSAFFNSAACAGTAVFATAAMTVPGNGTAVSSGNIGPIVAGVYTWKVDYTGNANNGAVSQCGGANETSSVAATPTTTTSTTSTTTTTTTPTTTTTTTPTSPTTKPIPPAASAAVVAPRFTG
jgi:hypothetical protein